MCGPTPSATTEVAPGQEQHSGAYTGAGRRAHEAIWAYRRDCGLARHPTDCMRLRMHPATWADVVVELRGVTEIRFYPLGETTLWGVPTLQDEHLPYGELVVECNHQLQVTVSGAKVA